MVSLSQSDRVLVVAPHPDDESLGTGGLLQRAFALRIPVRVLFVTNGDNNPWTQRFWEKRWSIRPDDRARWGRRRKLEALDAIKALGGGCGVARFLNLPDQGITDFLMEGDLNLIRWFAEEIQEWAPTRLVIPTELDAHPDHSALAVLLSLAIRSMGFPVARIWEYLIHRPSVPIDRPSVSLGLDTIEINRKLKAILAHRTQVALGGRRFTRFAAPNEIYYSADSIGTGRRERPLLAARFRENVLSLSVATCGRESLHSTLLLVLHSAGRLVHRSRIPLTIFSGSTRVLDCTTGEWRYEAKVSWRDSSVTVNIPLEDSFEGLFVKLSRPTLFFDRSGWRHAMIASEKGGNIVYEESGETIPSVAPVSFEL
jgi:LmbE family N-acetylglucosaminyl deacetylase